MRRNRFRKFVDPIGVALVAALVAVMGFVGTAKAATGLGPSEYLCFDTAATTATGNCAGKDSPFAGLDFAFFHLEDFENGGLDTPGVSATGQGLQVICQHPSQDSVDEDDGAIDGSGLGGCSLFSTSSGTGTNTAKIAFTFDENALGMFPTHVGIVWTDGLGAVDFKAFDENGALIAGCTSSGDHVGVGPFTGQTDEDRFYGCINDSGISIIEISTDGGASATGIEVDHLQYGKIAAQECVPAPSGLVSWWPGDGNADDIAGTNPGTLEGGAGFVSPGKVGDAFSVGGASTDFVLAERIDASLEPERVTLDAWVRRLGSPGSARYIAAKGASGCTASSYALYSGGGGLIFYVFNGSSFVLSPNAGTGVWDGNWHHAAGTYDGATVRLYVDGVEIGGGTATNISIGYGLPTNNDFSIGQYLGTCSLPFSGDVDEVEVFDRALSQAEIQSIYNAGSAGKCKVPTVPTFGIEIDAASRCTDLSGGCSVETDVVGTLLVEGPLDFEDLTGTFEGMTPGPQTLEFLLIEPPGETETASDVEGTVDAAFTVDLVCISACVEAEEPVCACPITITEGTCSFSGSAGDQIMGFTLACDDDAFDEVMGTAIIDLESGELIEIAGLEFTDLPLVLELTDKGCTGENALTCESTGTGETCPGGSLCFDVGIELDSTVEEAMSTCNGLDVTISTKLWTDAVNSLVATPSNGDFAVEFEGGFTGAPSDFVEFTVTVGICSDEATLCNQGDLCPDDQGMCSSELTLGPLPAPINTETSFFRGSYDLTDSGSCSIDYTSFESVIEGSGVPLPGLSADWRFVSPTPTNGLPTATCTLTGMLGEIGSTLEVETTTDALLQLIDPQNGMVLCEFTGDTTIGSESTPASLEKILLGGPDQTVEICLDDATAFTFVIFYSGPEALVVDTVPAEWVLTAGDCVPSNGSSVDVFSAKKGGGSGGATKIEWTVLAEENQTLTCTVETAESKGRMCNHKPTSCTEPGGLAINDGAVALATDGGDLVLNEKTGLPDVIVGPSNSLGITAVERQEPLRSCEEAQ